MPALVRLYPAGWRDLSRGNDIWYSEPANPPSPRRIDSGSRFVLNAPMSLLFEINRDFPYQVALSFDEAATDVLDWVEECDFEWDMYVDLPENTVRYCFRAVGDAAAFKRRFGHAAQRRAVAGGH